MTEAVGNVTLQPKRGVIPIRSTVIALAIGALIVAIGLAGGGYELPVSGETVVLAAWLLLIGAIVGVIPDTRPPLPATVATVAMAALTGWALLSIGWSDAAGRSVAVAVQYAVVLGTLLVGILVFRVGDRPAVLAGLLGGIASIAVIGVASRFHPGIAPEPTGLVDEARMQARLHWPVGYWNTLGFLAAMGLPLALHFAADARRAVGRALAAATIPALALCVLFTLSRGAIATAAVGIAIGIAFGPLTVRRLGVFAAALGGSAFVISEAVSRRALMDGLTASGPGVAQAGEVQTVAVAVAVVLAIVAAGAGFLPARLSDQRRDARVWLRALVGVALVGAVGVGLLAAGQGPRIERGFNDFRNAKLKVDVEKTNSIERLGAQGSSGRWQLWEEAVDQGNSEPLTGTGAGTFELWWTRNATEFFTVRNVHSQYLEVYAELGAVGLALMVVFLIALGWGCIEGLRRSRSGPQLGAAAAGTAAVAGFAFSTGFDWGWQVTVIPVVAMLAFAATTASGGEGEPAPAADPTTGAEGESAPADDGSGDGGVLVGMGGPGRGAVAWRLAGGVLAAALLALAVPPVVATHAVTESQRDFNDGDLVGALREANSAVQWQPYSAAAWLQKGLIYDSLGDSPRARSAVRKAIDREPDGWRNWLALAGVEARAGRVDASLRAYRRARDLNPNSYLFAVGN